ncbi:GntR family transcriptional regulator [Paraburkholderia silvatlantica]|uniref:GntR family transcriptional regulator n=1 Tax=Paraburkholderia silvatlantica TaxID=321895 RepID=A0A2U1ABS5_9BURK|nr:GntR family transcriptional regulator [Paraburkholderia silvatlantica]MBB2930330.1 DNA-binding GntR family transcriptional regulator [Paraburkholderia silvatlantica]PVY32160.1 GntR family transcriptional regulator [Paraburkholderia silvatlantica]PXW37780.1 GntR family transcriptional regulator [Paraburkholderia silvatlantica]PYE25601.1 GntR family transcriptional regulator [Paraburkholderia silvatlantica]TDQ97756.1 GntR family transcriptional regulator [Paraburkholderia silvatlantica]
MSIRSEISGTTADSREPSSSSPILHRQLSELVTARIRDSITTGAYGPGARLIEGRIAEELNVSRVPVREALRALAAEGLVEVRPRLGAVVASLDPASAREMVQIRATLEGLNARLAAEHCTPELARKVTDVLAEGNAKVAAGETEKLLELNARFHDLLYAAGANTMLADLMRTLRDRTRMLFVNATQDEIRQTWEEHAAILRAVQSGDAALAALLAERHVIRAAQHYLDKLSK